jgi:hypothetical protein
MPIKNPAWKKNGPPSFIVYTQLLYCYDDCCFLTVHDGDLNHDCIINTTDWGTMWSNWTKAIDL